MGKDRAVPDESAALDRAIGALWGESAIPAE
jgi:hypothetical protein